jgi:Mg-chelatase subunit ChlD
MQKLIFVSIFISSFCNAQLLFNERNIELGPIAEAYEIRGDVVINNSSGKKIFLMRADADRGVKVFTSKKTLQPGDTCLLIISFIPEDNGRFKKNIKIIASDKETPYDVSLSGSLAKVKTNDKTACYYFGKKHTTTGIAKEEMMIVPDENVTRDVSNKMPGSSPTPTARPRATITPKTVTTQSVPEKKPDEFSKEEYKPNNILFLVDISSSMRDSLKLPLMKIALYKLIDAVRDIDSITFVTYASKVNVVKEAVSGADKKTLRTLVDSLKAKGMTSGKTAILTSQQVAQKHFIASGNNQIIIATDGEFKFTNEDFKLWKQRQAAKKIILTTVAFGEEKVAIKNLKEIADKGEGSFIQINQRNGSEEKLLTEIKNRSRK